LRLISLLWLSLLFAATGKVQAEGIVSGYILVRVQEWASIDDIVKAINGDDDDNDEPTDTRVLEQVPNTRIYALHIPVGLTPLQFAARVRQIAGVLYAETDTFFGDPKSLPFDFIPPLKPLQPISDLISQRATLAEMQSAGVVTSGYINQTPYLQVGLRNAHHLAQGAGVKVAILDTGVNPDHPVLYGRCTQGYNAIRPDRLPLDLPDESGNRVVGHGTMIAGVIARIAPQADLIPIRVLNGDGIGTGLNVVKGIFFAISEGARVVNLSLSSSTRLQTLDEAVQAARAAGMVLIASAGNEGVNQGRYPASCAGVVAVASLDSNNVKSWFSNFGTYVGVCAPGNGIHGATWTGGFARWSGTSFAAPFVSGQATLLFSRNASLTGAQVVHRLLSTARSVNTQNASLGGQLGSGLIQIESSVR
jgi:subtilisin family serine protease